MLYHLLLLSVFVTQITMSNIAPVESKLTSLLGSNATMKWKVKVDLNSASNSIDCYIFDGEQKHIMRGVSQSDSQFIFVNTDAANEIYGNRIVGKQISENMEDLTDTFIIKIKSLKFSDENVYTCYYGNIRAKIHLNVVSKLQISGPTFDKTVSVNTDKITTITKTLCGKPAPILIWQFADQITDIHGENTNEPYCYRYDHMLHTPDQKLCGRNLKYTITDFNSSLTGYTKLLFDLKAKPVENLKVVMKIKNVFVISWYGPNIGTCIVQIIYQVKIVLQNSTQTYNTSSNNFEVVLHSNEVAKDIFVRTYINNQYSEYEKANIIQLYSVGTNVQRRLIIIITTVVLIALILTICGIMWYKFQYKRKRTQNKMNIPLKYSSIERLNQQEDLEGSIKDDIKVENLRPNLYASRDKEFNGGRPKSLSNQSQLGVDVIRKESAIERPMLPAPPLNQRPVVQGESIRPYVKPPIEQDDVYESMIGGRMSPGRMSPSKPTKYDTLKRNRDTPSVSSSVNGCYDHCESTDPLDSETEQNYDILNDKRHTPLGSSGSSGNNSLSGRNNSISERNDSLNGCKNPLLKRNNSINKDSTNYIYPDAIPTRKRLDSGDYNVIDDLKPNSHFSLYASIPHAEVTKPANHNLTKSTSNVVNKKNSTIVAPELIYDVIPRSNSYGTYKPKIKEKPSHLVNGDGGNKTLPRMRSTSAHNQRDSVHSKNKIDNEKDFKQYDPNNEALYDTVPKLNGNDTAPKINGHENKIINAKSNGEYNVPNVLKKNLNNSGDNKHYKDPKDQRIYANVAEILER